MPKQPDVQALNAMGLRTTGALIRACQTPDGRHKVAAETGLNEALLEKLAELTDWNKNGPLIDLLDQTVEPAGLNVIKSPDDLKD